MNPDINLTLRRATPEDVPILQHWDEQPHVVAADPNDYWAWETELQQSVDWREQLVAETNNRSIGFIQIIDPAREETQYWGGMDEGYRAIDIWIGEESDLGRGYGTQMMRPALNRCFAEPEVKSVLIDPLESNTKARRFYERLGFQFVEKRRFGEDDCLVYRLDREEWK